MWVGLSLVLVAQTAAEVSVGSDRYALSEPLLLAPFGLNASFSDDGRYVGFVAPLDEVTLPALRKMRAEDDQTPRSKNIVRFDSQTGRREVILRLDKQAETGELRFVGRGGDLLVGVEFPGPDPIVRSFEILFAPVGGSIRTVGKIKSKTTPQMGAMQSKPVTFLSIDDFEENMKLLQLDAKGSQEVAGTEGWQRAQPFGETRRGTFILCFIRTLGDSESALFEVDPAQRRAVRIEDPPVNIFDRREGPPIITYRRENGANPPKIEDPFTNFILAQGQDTDRPVLVFRGSTVAYDTSSDGLKIVANTSLGFFYREFVKRNGR